MAKDKKKKTKSGTASTTSRLVIVVIGLLAVIGGSIFILYLTGGHVATTQKLAQDLIREVDREGQLRSIEKLVGDIAEEKAIIATQFVPADNVVSFINTIEDLNDAIAADVLIGSVTEQKPNAEGIGNISMQIQVSGRWRDVLQAIALIETLPKATRIGDVVLAGSAGTWSSTFSIETLTGAPEE